MKDAPNPKCLKAARSLVEEAEDKVRTACKVMRRNNWPENADELMRVVKFIQTWTQKDGWFDCMERDPIAMENEK